jgi:hypothetical protein
MSKYQHVEFTHEHWLTRVRRSILIAALIVSSSLTIGICGYHFLGKLDWVDALLEASMILGGMGPVAPMANNAVKIFASFYALFSGLLLLSTMGILLAPWLQKMLYHTHRQARCDAVKDEQDG